MKVTVKKATIFQQEENQQETETKTFQEIQEEITKQMEQMRLSLMKMLLRLLLCFKQSLYKITITKGILCLAKYIKMLNPIWISQ